MQRVCPQIELMLAEVIASVLHMPDIFSAAVSLRFTHRYLLFVPY